MCEVVHVRAEHVREAQDRNGGVGMALGELVHRRLRLHDVLLDPGARLLRPAHRLVEEGRVVRVAAVEVGRGLDDHLANRRVSAGARGEDVHRPHHVVLVRLGRRGHRRIHHQARVDHRVDLRGLHHAPQERVLGADLHVLGALELDGRLLVVHSDHGLDLGERLERLGEPAAPVGREARDQDALRVHAATRTRPTCAWRACPRALPGCARGPRGPRSARAPCPRACPPRRSGWARGSAA